MQALYKANSSLCCWLLRLEISCSSIRPGLVIIFLWLIIKSLTIKTPMFILNHDAHFWINTVDVAHSNNFEQKQKIFSDNFMRILIGLFMFWEHNQKRCKTFSSTSHCAVLFHSSNAFKPCSFNLKCKVPPEWRALTWKQSKNFPTACSVHTYLSTECTLWINKNVSWAAFPKINWQRRECRAHTRELALGRSHGNNSTRQCGDVACYLISSPSPRSHGVSKREAQNI